jgi:hypothetical protein
MEGGRCAFHPDIEAVGVCERCGDFVCQNCWGEFQEKRLCKRCIPNEERRLGGYCPWEDRKRIGLFKGMFETSKDILLHPTNTFSTLPLSGGYLSPLIFGTIFLSFSFIINHLYQMLFSGLILLIVATFAQQSEPQMIINLLSSIISIPLSPFFALGWLFIWAGVYHLCLLLVGARSHGFEATFRLISYAQVALVIDIIPVVGASISWIWRLVLLVIAFKNGLSLSIGRAIISALLPIGFLIAFFIFIFVGIMALIAMIIVLAMGT